MFVDVADCNGKGLKRQASVITGGSYGDVVTRRKFSVKVICDGNDTAGWIYGKASFSRIIK